jgi:hypothetical protein
MLSNLHNWIAWHVQPRFRGVELHNTLMMSHRDRILSDISLIECVIDLQISHFKESAEITGLFTKQEVGKSPLRV